MADFDVVAYVNELAARLFGFAFLALVVGLCLALLAVGVTGIVGTRRARRRPLTA